MFINKHIANKCHLRFASHRTFPSGVWKGRCIVPSQAGNLPAKSKRNSSSQTGDLSYPDHTGEYWFQRLSWLPGSEGLSGTSWTPTAPRVYIFSLSQSSSNKWSKKWEMGPLPGPETRHRILFLSLKSLGNCYKAMDLLCVVRHNPFCFYFYFMLYVWVRTHVYRVGDYL